MKSTFAVLTKRELKALFPIKKFKLKNFDVLGTLLNLVIVASLGLAYVLVMSAMIDNYLAITLRDSTLSVAEQLVQRQIEFMTLAYTIIILSGIVFGVGKINKSITYDKDMENLLRLPISTQEIFLSKITTLYLSQMVFTSLFVIPVNITFFITTPQEIWFWFATVITCILLPAIPFLLSSLIALPVKYVTNWLRTKYVLLAVLFVALLAGAFLLYSKLLALIEEMFLTEKIKVVFNDASVSFIIGVSKYSYPARWYVNFIYNQKTLLNLLFAVLATVGAFGLVYLVTLKLFKNYILHGANIKKAYNKRGKSHKKSPFAALVWKEFVTVLRTPDYAFSYFATAFVLPLMVLSSATLLDQLIIRLIAFDFSYEISLLSITMFAVLTNTFCAGNISRDGDMFMTNKSLPTSAADYVGAKILFCSITNVISVFAACLTLLITNFIGGKEFVVIAFSALMLTTGEIFIATRKDLAKPQFNLATNPEANSKTVSFVIILGFFISVIIAVIALGINVLGESKLKLANAKLVETIVTLGLSALFCGLSAVTLFVGLKKKINNTFG